jgi:hypothetical protein
VNGRRPPLRSVHHGASLTTTVRAARPRRWRRLRWR